MTERNFFGVLFLAALAVMVFISCGPEPERVTEKKADKAEPIARAEVPMAVANQEPAQPEAAESGWTYNPTGKWDSFIKPEDPIGPTKKGGDGFDLDQMSLMGVVAGSGMDGAYVRMPNNTDRIVRLNDTLGKHKGKVIEISSKGYLVVEERYLRPDTGEIWVIQKTLYMAKNGKDNNL